MAKVTFDGIDRLIYIDPSASVLDVEVDVYSDWKEWLLIGDNSKYLAALRATGGDPLPGSRNVGRYFFLINDWKLVYPSHSIASEITLEGNLFSDDGTNIFYSGSLTNIRLVRQVVSQYTEINTVAGGSGSGGLTPAESTQLNAVYGSTNFLTASVTDLITINNEQTASLNTLLSDSTSQNNQLTYLVAVNNQQTGSLTEISSSVSVLDTKLDALLSTSGSGLTPTQATMLLEMYRLLGLDPTKPLLVSPAARTAGAEISQSISQAGDTVTVTRT